MASYDVRHYEGSEDDSPRHGAMGEHNGSQIALVLVNTLMFATATVLVHLWAFPSYAGGIYKNEYRNLTLSYEIPVTPSQWTVVMWSITMGWLLVCKVYTLVLLCRRNAVGPVYKSPPIVGPWFLFTYTLGLFCVIAWTIVWDRDNPIASTVIISVAAILCWIATAALYQSVYFHGGWLSRHAKPDLWIYRILWHNGMAAFTTWLTITAIYLIGVTVRVKAGVSLQDVVYIVLGCISGVMLVWFILENSVADRYGRYTFTHYAVVVFLMVGVYDRQYKITSDPTKYFIIALLAASVCFLVVRILVSILRAIKCPLYSSNKVEDDPVLSYKG